MSDLLKVLIQPEIVEEVLRTGYESPVAVIENGLPEDAKLVMASMEEGRLCLVFRSPSSDTPFDFPSDVHPRIATKSLRKKKEKDE